MCTVCDPVEAGGRISLKGDENTGFSSVEKKKKTLIYPLLQQRFFLIRVRM